MFYTKKGCTSLKALEYKFSQGGSESFLYKCTVRLAWINGGLGSVRFIVGLSDVRDLFQSI